MSGAGEPRAAYVHVPFCRHRCGYCDFAVLVGRDDLAERYFQALSRELDRPARPLVVDTLYVGGGTPTHLGAAGLARLWETFHGRIAPVAGAEVTIEANPADVSAELVVAALGCGVTRVSLGAQSLSEPVLAALDRDHGPADVRCAVGLLHDAGLDVSLDLMVAAPGQRQAEVEADLDAAVALEPEHLSVYCLTWERGTRFGTRLARGLVERADEDLERRMVEGAIDRLSAAGFEHYEISNFARPGRRCRHNETYWDLRPWEAFGPGAARFDGRVRTANHRSPFTWMQRLETGADPSADVERMDDEEAARERICVGLRRCDGIDRNSFLEAAGIPFDDLAGAFLGDWIAAGLATDDGARVRLTREGMLVSDAMWGGILRSRTGRGGTAGTAEKPPIPGHAGGACP